MSRIQELAKQRMASGGKRYKKTARDASPEPSTYDPNAKQPSPKRKFGSTESSPAAPGKRWALKPKPTPTLDPNFKPTPRINQRGGTLPESDSKFKPVPRTKQR